MVDVSYPGELKIYLSKERLPSLADAKHELDRLELHPDAGREVEGEYVFIVPLPEARKNAIVNLLSDKELTFQPRYERYPTTRAALRLDGDTLAIGAMPAAKASTVVRVPWSQVTAVGVPAPVTIGPDAFILVEGERPSQLWWAPLISVLLVIFAAFNMWYLVRSVRTRAA
jgi:hypothetical protein